VKISPNAVTTSSNPEAKLQYVEHSGTAFEAGLKDMAMLEEQMEALGLQPLVRGSAKRTATATVVEENKQDSQAQAWIRELEEALTRGFAIAESWVGKELDEKFAVSIFNEFSLSIRAKDDVDHLLTMRLAVPPQISHDTFIDEVRRRAVVADDVDAEIEREKIGEEILSLLGATEEVEEVEEEEDA